MRKKNRLIWKEGEKKSVSKIIESAQIIKERNKMLMNKLLNGEIIYIRRNATWYTNRHCTSKDTIEFEFIKYDGKFIFLRSIKGRYQETFTFSQLYDHAIFKEAIL